VRRRLAGFIRRPAPEQIRALAALEYMALTPDELTEMVVLVDRYLKFMDRLDDLPAPELPVKYPDRERGYRPDEAEDPHNLFIRKCRVQGAASGPLSGRTVAVKDNICVAGVPMTNGSRLLAGFVPDVDAVVVERLLDAGALLIGKLNCDDFSFSGTGETSHFGIVPNPHNPAYSAGGSSSGAGAAVVLGEADLALAVDNGGSGRIPASWCGAVCIKSSHGLVPTFGVTPLDPTTDFVCPMARSVADVAVALEVIAGDDPRDAQWVRGAIRTDAYSRALGQDVRGLRIGRLKEGLSEDAVEPDVQDAYEAALRLLEREGAVLRDVSLPLWSDAQAIWTSFVAHSLSTIVENNLEGFGRLGWCNLAWQDAFGKARRTAADLLPPVMKVLMVVGKYMRREYGSVYFSKATNLRFDFRRRFDALFDQVDVIATPTTPTKAFRLVDHPVGLREVVEARATSMALNTYPTNLSGHPSISLPCGRGENNLPIGLQFVAPHFAESLLFRVASSYERSFAGAAHA
jgi:amidase